MEQSSVQAAEGGGVEKKNTYPKIQFVHVKRSHLLSGLKRSLVASGSAATAGKLNKHCYSCFAVQIYVSKGHGAVHRVRCGSSVAGHS